MIKIKREDLHIIGRHSNLPENEAEKILKRNIYNNVEDWKKFLRLFIISLGIGFTTAGIVFFFAYNWADLHKFIKLGIIESLIVITTGVVLLSKINIDIKNIIITGATVLVGVLFAVFGQIYQTGANAYDFFLGWTMFVTIWVIVANFSPLWLVYLTLVNTTLILYSQQVAHDWSDVFLFTMLLLINSGFLIGILLRIKIINKIKSPNWFTNIFALASVFFATIGIIIGIFDSSASQLWFLVLFTSLLYGSGIKYGLNIKSGFYLSIIPFSVIVIISALLIKISEDEAMFFFVSLFIITSVTLVIKNLINLQKKWNNG
ncbi:MAG: DUF2157 domain-containing protein [Bacteroidota bacterium]